MSGLSLEWERIAQQGEAEKYLSGFVSCSVRKTRRAESSNPALARPTASRVLNKSFEGRLICLKRN